jgi:hypothetical protein
VTFSLLVSIAAIFASHSLSEIRLLGVLLNSAQIGMFSINIADNRQKKSIVIFIYLSASPSEDFFQKVAVFVVV